MAKCKRYASECKRGCTTSCACENSYRPSNGTEGMIFEDNFCSHCIHDNAAKEKYCPIITAAMCFNPTEPEYPKEWIIKDEEPHCTNFVKWDWNNDGDPDDPDNPKAPPPPPDPNQLNLFPLYPDEKTFNHVSDVTRIYAAIPMEG